MNKSDWRQRTKTKLKLRETQQRLEREFRNGVIGFWQFSSEMRRIERLYEALVR